MKKIMILFLAAIAIQSCSKEEPKPLTKEEIAQQVDSIAKQRIKLVEEEATKELEYRMKIEVKIKADSILREMLHRNDSARRADSVK